MYSLSEGGPLSFPQLLVSMLAMLKFVCFFGQQYKFICSHLRPLQQTVPQYVGLDVHLTCMRFRLALAH